MDREKEIKELYLVFIGIDSNQHNNIYNPNYTKAEYVIDSVCRGADEVCREMAREIIEYCNWRIEGIDKVLKQMPKDMPPQGEGVRCRDYSCRDMEDSFLKGQKDGQAHGYENIKSYIARKYGVEGE